MIDGYCFPGSFNYESYLQMWRERRYGSESHWHNEIAKIAKIIWEKKGCPECQDEKIWLEAEEAVMYNDLHYAGLSSWG